jgi:hypothetical protein
MVGCVGLLQDMDARLGTAFEQAYLVGRDEAGGLPRVGPSPQVTVDLVSVDSPRLRRMATVAPARAAPPTPEPVRMPRKRRRVRPPSAAMYAPVAPAAQVPRPAGVSGRTGQVRLAAALARVVLLPRLPAPGTLPECAVCTGTLSRAENRLRLCDRCGRSYHTGCCTGRVLCASCGV